MYGADHGNTNTLVVADKGKDRYLYDGRNLKVAIYQARDRSS
jgi:hypothetical protein